ncbi:MAG: MoxR family ATPase [Clostridiales Family XIII bacterium]|jgi:MoxR-like ATPase|nr:MoxR family ATPase [Clostridiales Family XIII bacterium]
MAETFREAYGGSADYVLSDELRGAVNIAVALEKPLLIKGEPGTGKTMLARSIADALGKELIVWSIKSTTKAQDGLYHYDTVQRLYDSQFGEGDVKDIARYIKLGRLGEAFTSADRAVLLIDEIDKADLEFPNDLLWELDQMEFYIPETKETVRAASRPIVVITSNAEKELPDAFLRRCIFHYIAFPEPEQMERIVRVHYPDLEDALVAAAIEKFYELRGIGDLQKKPATSELLDWLLALSLSGIPAERLAAEIPFLGVLLKKNEDTDTYQEVQEKGYSLRGFKRPPG